MSLFKLRDSWAARFPDEEFETRGMALGDVLNETKDSREVAQQIVVGSFKGFVRVYRPSNKGTQSDDLIVEHNVGAPVLQVAVAPCHTLLQQQQQGGSGGGAGGGAKSQIVNALVILCPRKLVIIYISAVQNQQKSSAEGGNNDNKDAAGEEISNIATGAAYKVEVIGETLQQRTAHSFCCGAFGRPQSPKPDAVCVQSMDGNLQFYSSGRHTWFNRFLPSNSFLVPGCLTYIDKTDQFYVSTSTLSVECYSFSALAGASASEVKSHENNTDPSKIVGQKLLPDWNFVVGEDVLQIKEVRLLQHALGVYKDDTQIGVLAEHSFLLLSSKGALIFNIRLDYAPMCMAVFPKPSKPELHQLILASATGSYFIHADNKVIWSAKAASAAPPICCEVASGMMCNNTRGMIVVLTDDGTLTINYLGTDPATESSVQLLQREELDIEATLKENTELQQAIASAAAGQGGKIAEAAQEKRAEAESWEPLEISFDTPLLDYEQGTVSTSFYIYFPGDSQLCNVVLTLSAALPIAPASSTFTIASLPGRSRVSIPVTFGIKPEFQQLVPSSLLVDAVATYETPSSTGESSASSRTILSRTSFALPLGIVCRPIPQVKNSPYKLQIDIKNRETIPQVDQLFDDIVVFNQECASTNALSVQFSSGLDATVLLSKNGARYRVQSSSFPGLWLLTSELLRRLRKVCNGDVVTEFPDDVPLSDLFAAIDAHYAARYQLQSAMKTIELLSEQFRAVERRLIARFREQNPAPMKSMQSLFEVTYRSLRDACEGAERCQVTLKAQSSSLACAVHLTLLISKYKLQLGRDDFEMLRNFLSPNVEDSSAASDLWWEETTVSGLTHLLRTTLSRNAAAGSVVAQPLQTQEDTSRVKKNISLVFERLSKGAKMSGGVAGTD